MTAKQLIDVLQNVDPETKVCIMQCVRDMSEENDEEFCKRDLIASNHFIDYEGAELALIEAEIGMELVQNKKFPYMDSQGERQETNNVFAIYF